jgi:hypothetical protein
VTLKKRAILAGLLLSVASGVAARPAPLPRIEVPIGAVVLSDGARRYTITLRIAGKEVIAGLDTGSTGLRVLHRGLPADAAGMAGPAGDYFYGSGTRFTGRTIDVAVGLGASPDVPLRVQRIDQVGCTRDKPDCPASHVAVDSFGIQGDGLPNEGFAAIAGVGLKSDADPNLFEALGATRWIIELPRPGEATGRLILDPSDAEIADYHRIKLLGDDNMVAGCLAFAAPARPICGPARLDSGAPGLRVVSGERHAPVPQGTPARIVIGDKAEQIGFDVQVGRRDQASGLRFEQRDGMRDTQLFFGIAPYFAWDVLYDPGTHTIGIKPR